MSINISSLRSRCSQWVVFAWHEVHHRIPRYNFDAYQFMLVGIISQQYMLIMTVPSVQLGEERASFFLRKKRYRRCRATSDKVWFRVYVPRHPSQVRAGRKASHNSNRLYYESKIYENVVRADHLYYLVHPQIFAKEWWFSWSCEPNVFQNTMCSARNCKLLWHSCTWYRKVTHHLQTLYKTHKYIHYSSHAFIHLHKLLWSALEVMHLQTLSTLQNQTIHNQLLLLQRCNSVISTVKLS